MKFKAAIVVLFFLPVMTQAAENNKSAESGINAHKEKVMNKADTTFFSNKTLQWEWIEGDYAGAVYENAFDADGTMVWKGIRGGEKGQSRKENYIAHDISGNVSTASWFEPTVGATVSVILNTDTQDIYGFISDKNNRVALKGKFTVIR